MTLAARIHLKRQTEFHTTGPVQMHTMRYRLGNEIPHDHDFHELVLVKGGVGTHITAEGEYRIVRGCVFVICPGQVHNYGGLDSLDIVNFLYVPRELEDSFGCLPGARGLVHNQPGIPFVVLNETDMGQIEEIVMEIHLEQERRAAGWEYFVRMAFLRIAGIICRAAMPENGKPGSEDNWLIRLLRFLERNHGQQLRLAELARMCGMSTSTLVHQFQALTGTSLIDTLIKLRLEKGAVLLRDTDMNIIEIAIRVGFQSSSYFARMFRRKFKVSPREYRRNFRRFSA